MMMSAVTLEAAKQFIQVRMDQETVFAKHPMRPAERRRLSPFTIHIDVRNLRRFGSWLTEQGYANGLRELKLPKLPKTMIETLADEEVQTLFDAYNPDTHFGARWQAILAFFLFTGVRLSELAGLRLPDLDMTHLRAKVVGKGDKERYVKFGNVAHRCLSRYLNLFRTNVEHEAVFLSLEGEPLTVNGVQNIVKNVRRKTGIARIHCHLFRHTFATNFLLAGGHEFELQMLLGHESLEMTRRYVHLAQQLSKRGGEAQELKRASLLDEMFDLSISLRGRGSRRRVANGQYAPRSDSGPSRGG